MDILLNCSDSLFNLLFSLSILSVFPWYSKQTLTIKQSIVFTSHSNGSYIRYVKATKANYIANCFGTVQREIARACPYRNPTILNRSRFLFLFSLHICFVFLVFVSIVSSHFIWMCIYKAIYTIRHLMIIPQTTRVVSFRSHSTAINNKRKSNMKKTFRGKEKKERERERENGEWEICVPHMSRNPLSFYKAHTL